MNPEELHKAISEHKDGDIANSLSELGYFDDMDEFDEQLSEHVHVHIESENVYTAYKHEKHFVDKSDYFFVYIRFEVIYDSDLLPFSFTPHKESDDYVIADTDMDWLEAA